MWSKSYGETLYHCNVLCHGNFVRLQNSKWHKTKYIKMKENKTRFQTLYELYKSQQEILQALETMLIAECKKNRKEYNHS